MRAVVTENSNAPVPFRNNLVVLRGVLGTSLSTRETPAGPVCDATLRVQSDLDGKSQLEQVPLAWTGGVDRFPGLQVSAELVVVGRVRQRFFRSGASTVSRTEVVVEHVAPTNRRTSTKKLFARLTDDLATMTERR